MAAAEPLVLPGVSDALGARLTDRAGFAAAYATGAGIANAQFGVADVGLVSLAEVVEQVERITDATDRPVVVDADTGHGGPLSVMRTVHLLERAGAAGIQIEDQQMPKRCGHFDGHQLIDSAEMVAKIHAARRARSTQGAEALVIIARTDARGVYGIDEALRRGHQYLDAGADALFIEAPREVEELERIGTEFGGIPLVANIVEGGKTTPLSVAELAALGFSVVLYANFLMRAMAWAGQRALAYLAEHGETNGFADRILPWDQRQELFALPELTALDGAYADVIAETQA
jgi:2-methylisocitrate lyase-like PEP mutase family enzyme